MNSGADTTNRICRSCQTRPATTTYTDRNGKQTEQVCGRCLDRLEILEAFDWGVLDSRAWADKDQYDKILDWLDAFEKEHRHRDHDARLARSIAAHRALTYWEAERYEESLAACEKVEAFGFEDVWYRWTAASAKASALEGLERHAEALAAIEEAFRHQDPRFMRSACFFLPTLVKYSTNAGKPVAESWRKLGHDIADHYHVEFPDRPALAESLLALFEMTEKKNCVYEDESEPQSEDKP